MWTGTPHSAPTRLALSPIPDEHWEWEEAWKSRKSMNLGAWQTQV